MAKLGEPGDRTIDRARFVQVILVEVDIEVDTKVVQARLDLVEHEVDALRTEGLLQLFGRERGEVTVVGERNAASDVADVAAAVPVFGRGLAQVRGDEAASEAVDLRTVIVEVVLPRHLGALRAEDARKRVTNGGPARAAKVNGPGGVGRDELEVDDLVSARLVGAEGGALVDDRLRERAGGCGIQSHVNEAGAGDLDGCNAVDRLQRLGNRGRELTRVGAHALRELHGDVRGPIAVIAVLRALKHHVGDGEVGRTAGSSSLKNRGDDGEQLGGENVWSHGGTILRGCR